MKVNYNCQPIEAISSQNTDRQSIVKNAQIYNTFTTKQQQEVIDTCYLNSLAYML